MSSKKLTRKKAIKAKCLDCSGGIRAEVRRCTATNCPLWPFRMGTETKSSATNEVKVKMEGVL